MNPAPDSTFWVHLFGWLAGETTLVIGLAALAAWLMRSAAWRRSVWQSAFVALALILLAELTGAGRQLLPQPVPRNKTVRRITVRGNLPATAQESPRDAMASPVVLPVKGEAKGSIAPNSLPWWPGWLWLAGAAVLLVRLAAARLLLVAAGTRGRDAVDAGIFARIEAIRRRLGFRQKVRVVEFRCLRSPIAFGLLQPTIGLPAGFGEAFSPAQQEAMLAHELAHLAARDPLWHGLAGLVVAALWWHPLGWWAARRLRAASESAADEASLVVDNGPAALAECLVELGRRLSRRRALGWLGVEGGGYRSGLGRRVERLLELEGASWRPAGGLRKLLLLGASGFVAAVAVAVSAWASAQDAQSPSLAGFVQLALAGGEDQSPESSAQAASVRTPVVVTNKLNAATLVRDGRLLYEMGKLEDAQSKLKQAVQLDPANQAAQYYLNLIQEARNERGTRTNSLSRTNLVRTSAGRQRIVSLLKRIQIPKTKYDNLPLSEVVRSLSEDVRRLDPDGEGINFIIANSPPGTVQAGSINSATDVPGTPRAANEASEGVGAVRIMLNPPFPKARLLDLLDAITKVADKPIKFAIEDFGIVFSARGNEPGPLYVRTYKVDANTFLEALERFAPAPASAGDTNRAARIQQAALSFFFENSGVDLSAGTGKAIFFNERTGALLVRATLQDLDIIESAIQVLNTAPLQVLIKAKFVEITEGDSRTLGFDWFLGNVILNSPTGTNAAVPSASNTSGVFPGVPGGIAQKPPSDPNAAVFRELRGDELEWSGRTPTNAHDIRVSATLRSEVTGILTEPQFRVLLHALEQRQGVEIVSSPQVATLSGRHAQIQVGELRSVATGINPAALATPGSRPPAGTNASALLVEPVQTGLMLDMVPDVTADGYTIGLTVIARITEFVGYDPAPPKDDKIRVWQDGREEMVARPLPRFRVREMRTRANIWDGQTLVLGGPGAEPVSDAKATAAKPGQPVRKRLLVFLTPTIINPAGNRVHTDDEKPSGKPAVPPQK